MAIVEHSAIHNEMVCKGERFGQIDVVARGMPLRQLFGLGKCNT